MEFNLSSFENQFLKGKYDWCLKNLDFFNTDGKENNVQQKIELEIWKLRILKNIITLTSDGYVEWGKFDQSIEGYFEFKVSDRETDLITNFQRLVNQLKQKNKSLNVNIEEISLWIKYFELTTKSLILSSDSPRDFEFHDSTKSYTEIDKVSTDQCREEIAQVIIDLSTKEQEIGYYKKQWWELLFRFGEIEVIRPLNRSFREIMVQINENDPLFLQQLNTEALELNEQLRIDLKGADYYKTEVEKSSLKILQQEANFQWFLLKLNELKLRLALSIINNVDDLSVQKATNTQFRTSVDTLYSKNMELGNFLFSSWLIFHYATYVNQLADSEKDKLIESDQQTIHRNMYKIKLGKTKQDDKEFWLFPRYRWGSNILFNASIEDLFVHDLTQSFIERSMKSLNDEQRSIDLYVPFSDIYDLLNQSIAESDFELPITSHFGYQILMGLISHFNGELTNALSSFQSAKLLGSSSDDSQIPSAIIIHLDVLISMTYQEMGEYNRVTKLLEKIIEDPLVAISDRAMSYSILISTYLSKNTGKGTKKAIYYELKFNDFIEKIEDVQEWVYVKYLLAKALILINKNRIETISEGMNVYKKIVFDLMNTPILLKFSAIANLCKLLIKEFDLTGNDDVLQEAYDLEKIISLYANETSFPSLIIDSLILLSKFEILKDKPELAENSLRKALTIAIENNLFDTTELLEKELQDLDEAVSRWYDLFTGSEKIRSRIENSNIMEYLDNMLEITKKDFG